MADKPFILVLVSFFKDQDKGPQPIMAPFAHIGMEMPTKEAVDAIAEQGKAAGCLAWPPTLMPDPIGYILRAHRSRHGNMIEFSFDQGVYEAQEVGGRDPEREVCTSYLASFASGDADRVVAHVTDDFVNEHTAALGSGCEGKAEYARRAELPRLDAAPSLRGRGRGGRRRSRGRGLHTPHPPQRPRRGRARRDALPGARGPRRTSHRLLGQSRVPAAGRPGVSTPIPRRTLGHSGIEVSTLALGVMMFGRWGNTDEAECHRMLHRALDAGITLIDTADMYDDGASEEILGRGLRGRRDRVVLATKVGNPMGGDPTRSGLSRRWIEQAVEDSLRRLQVDHIDLYQMHRPDPSTPMEETLETLDRLVGSGKVRAIGTSTFSPTQLDDLHALAGDRDWVRPTSEQ
ncbi:MAG: aldo/keto reductase, partial [Ilumatobacteraceae bacterium]